MTEHVKAFAGYDLGDGESIIDFAILDTKKMKHEFSVNFSGLSSKLCMRFFLRHFRETVCVSHIEVT